MLSFLCRIKLSQLSAVWIKQTARRTRSACVLGCVCVCVFSRVHITSARAGDGVAIRMIIGSRLVNLYNLECVNALCVSRCVCTCYVA